MDRTGMLRFAPVLLLFLPLAANPAESDPRRDARAPLDVLAASFGGWEAMRAGRTLAYRLTVTDEDQAVRRDARYRLDLASGAVWSRDLLTGEETEWDGTTGRRRRGQAEATRDDAAGERLRTHAAYNFLRLLRDPATRAEWQGAWRIRLHPAGAAAFAVELDPSNGRIRSNHFDDGAFSTEEDYQPVGALVWPMRFVVPSASGGRTGVFRDVQLLAEPALPAPRE
jgi:hypothetical protein